MKLFPGETRLRTFLSSETAIDSLTTLSLYAPQILGICSWQKGVRYLRVNKSVTLLLASKASHCWNNSLRHFLKSGLATCYLNPTESTPLTIPTFRDITIETDVFNVICCQD